MGTTTRVYRDGTVTVWDVYQQRWAHRIDARCVSDQVLSSLPDPARRRVIAAARRLAEEGA